MAEAEVIGAGAAEKRVRVVEGRRRKEAKSLEAIVAVSWVLVLLVRLFGGAPMRCAEVIDADLDLEVRGLHFKMVRAIGGSMLHKPLTFSRSLVSEWWYQPLWYTDNLQVPTGY